MDTFSPVATATSLSHLALLAVRGADARTFLDAQLTRNVPGATGTATLAGYCSPKGRLLAIFTMWFDGETTFLLGSRDIADTIAKRLRMYVLRAKATIEDVTATRAIAGIVDTIDAPPLETWRTHVDGDVTWIRLPDVDGRSRLLRIAPLDAAPPARAVDETTWRGLDIASGLPTIAAPVQDRFVPQMVNLEALGGVDFKKGCFPGQEVVARSQYLGKLKRRMAIATLPIDADIPLPGSDVLDGADPVGLVVAAERGAERVALLVELPLDRFASTTLTTTPSGPALTLAMPPYPLPDNEVFVRPKL